MTDTPRRILHLDMDAFFASVEVRDDPSLAGLPVIIGNNPRGVVAAASYAARTYGVRSAMPVVQAQRLCPQGIFLPGRHHRYSEVSREIMALVREFSPLVEQTSVDEAYLDISGMERLRGAPLDMARAIKATIHQATGLTCSVGIAPNRFLAKISSDEQKPDGITILEPEDVAAFLERLSVAKVPGIGPRTVAVLRTYGIEFLAQVRRWPLEFWRARFGAKGGEFLWQRAHGLGSAEVVADHEPKSSGAENTFAADTSDREVLGQWLLHQAERVGRDLRRHGLQGRTVTLKVKFADFQTITRSQTLEAPVSDTASIYAAAATLLAAETLPKPVRLIGLSVGNFGQGNRQLSLFEEPGESKNLRLDTTLDAIAAKFGGGAVVRGGLFDFRKNKPPR